MASYRIVFKRSVARDLKPLPTRDVRRIMERISRLAHDPRPSGAEKLSGDEKYCLRLGRYRILYSVDDNIITVTVIKVGHRRDAYA